MTRRRGQSLGGRYRSQPVDPVTGRRMNLAGRTLSELESRLRRVDHVRDGLKFGDIGVREAKGMLRPAVGMTLAVRSLAEAYLRGIPEASIDVYRTTWKNLLEPWFGEKVVWDLEESELRAWKTELERVRRPRGKRGYAPKTIRFAWDFLKGCVNLAIRDGRLSEVPWGDFKVPNPKRPQKEREATRDVGEFLALLAAARAYDEKHRRRHDPAFPPLCFLALTGCRQAEAAGLTWSDVDLERDPPELHIRRQAKRGWKKREGTPRPERFPKGKIARVQVLHPDAVRLLRMQMHKLKTEGRFTPDGPVFPRQGSAGFRNTGYVIRPSAFKKIVALAGLPSVEHWTPHSLKHSFARLELIGHGGDLRTVAERTGNRDLEVLQGYMQRPARQIGGSKIPELPPALLPSTTIEAPAPRPELPAKSLPPPTPEPDAPPENNWTDHARAWVAAGRPKRRPAAVTAEMKGIYSRAYNAELRATGSKEAAALAAKRAWNGALGAWGKAIARLSVTNGRAPEPDAPLDELPRVDG